MTFPNIPTPPSISKRPTEYMVGLAFAICVLANEQFGADLSEIVIGVICTIVGFVTSAVIDLIGADPTDDPASAEAFPEDE